MVLSFRIGPKNLHSSCQTKQIKKRSSDSDLKALLMAQLPLEDPATYTELVCRLMK